MATLARVLLFELLITFVVYTCGSPGKTLVKTVVCTQCKCDNTTNELTINCTAQDFGHLPNQWPEQTVKLHITVDETAHIEVLNLTGLRKLTDLNIGQRIVFPNNKKSAPLLSAEVFRELVSLRRLGLHFLCNAISRGVFDELHNIEEVDLSDTLEINLKELTDALWGLAGKPLRRLVLRSAQPFRSDPLTATLDLAVFLRPLRNTSLEHLDLSNNAISKMNPGLILNVPRLKTFFVRHNYLLQNTPASFHIDVFMHPGLEEFDLSYQGRQGPSSKRSVGRRRRIRAPAATEPSIADCLQHSKASAPGPANQQFCKFLKCYLPEWFTGIPCEVLPTAEELLTSDSTCYKNIRFPVGKNLKRAAYSHTAFVHDIGFHVGGEFNDKSFCINEDNNLVSVDISDIGGGRMAFFDSLRMKGLNKVEHVTVENNDMRLGDLSFMNNFPSLRKLKARGNDFSANPGNVVHPLLRFLDVSQCQVKSLRAILTNFPNLEVLKVSNNRLQLVELQALDLTMSPAQNLTMTMSLSSLRHLNLSDNELEAVPRHLRHQMDAIASDGGFSLDLTANPLSCSCTNFDFLTWMRSTPVTLENMEYSCSTPDQGRIPINQIDIDAVKNMCFPSYVKVVVISVTMTIAAAVVCILIALLVKKRWKIRYVLFVMRRSWQRYLAQKVSREYRYDAFVSYNSEDRFWVHDHLRTKLEDEHGLRLCLHYRDFLPGHVIEDTIVESIDESRKTILILSPNFIRSNWCQFELQMARLKLFDTGKDVLVLIILQSLPATGVNKSLTKLLQTKTYLSWTEDSDGKKLFWEQLVSTLRDDVFPFEE